MKTRILKPFLAIILLAIIFFYSIAFSDNGSGFFGKEKQISEQDLLRHLRDTTIDLSNLPGKLYGKANNENLADIIFFFDSSISRSRVALIQRNEVEQETFGEPYIHCLIFAVKSDELVSKDSGISALKPQSKDINYINSHQTKPVNGKIEITNKIDTTISLKNLKEKPEFPAEISFTQVGHSTGEGEFALLSGLIKAVTTIIAGVPEAKKKDIPSKDTSFTVDLDKWNSSSKDVTLYWNYFKLPIANNTVNRFTVRLDDGELNGTHTFGNYSASRLGLSIGVIGAILDKDTQVNDDVEAFWIKPYLLGHIYIKRPNVPEPHFNDEWERFRHKVSFSLVFGPKLGKEDLFEDFFVGCSIGHIYGPLGVVGGMSRRNRKMEPSLGVHLHF